MKSQTAMALLLVIGVVLGFSASSLYSTSNLFSTVPDGHAAVAQTITVQDMTLGKTYAATFVSSGTSPALSIVSLSFTSGSKVAYSKWEFRATPTDGATAYAVMTIWGPDNTGNYFVEIGRMTTDAMQLTFPGGSMAWGASGNDGYVYFLTSYPLFFS